MRILHINCNYASTPLHQLMIEKLDNLGIDNTVYAPIYDLSQIIIEHRKNVYISKCFNKWDRIAFGYKQKKIFTDIERLFDIKSFDLIHAYTLFTDGNCARLLSEKYGVPYVVAVRNTDVNTFFRYVLHLRPKGVKIMKNAEKIFFLSRSYKNTVSEKYIPIQIKDLILQKSIEIPNGIDDFWLKNKFEERDYALIKERFSNKELRILYVGDIDKNKNIGLTVEAIKKLAIEGWTVRFDVVGRIVDQAVFNELLSFNMLCYTSKLPKEELLKKYREADIFVMPSHNESFGLVYAEAMSQGLPVIYTRGQGFDGQFEDGEVGYAVSDKDHNEVLQSLNSIIKNYHSTSTNCIKNVYKFDWSVIAQKYISIYSNIYNENCPG